MRNPLRNLCRLSCCLIGVSAWALTSVSPCDLNQDGVVNVLDVQMAINMYNGIQTCAANIDGPNVCNQYVVNQVITAALGGTCAVVPGGTHTVTLTWTPSTSPDVTSYNVYRSQSSASGYTLLNSSNTTSFVDSTVAAGYAYYYYATAVDSSGKESVASNIAQASVSFP